MAVYPGLGLPPTQAKEGKTPPEGFLFDSSGIPYEATYLGNVSVSTSVDNPHIIVGDPTSLVYGKLPLSAAGSAYGFVSSKIQGIPTTANANTASFSTGTPTEFGTAQFALRTIGTTALVVFVRTQGVTLSGFVALGPVI